MKKQIKNTKSEDQPSEIKKPLRLLSIDALRGFDMLLISGGGTFLVLLENNTGLAWIDWMAGQMKHPAWNGFTFYDFIFPLFLVIAGVSMAFSLNKGIEMGLSKAELYRKAFWRMLLLVILGILDKNQPVTFFEPSQIRVASVLGRIGVAGFFASLLYLNFNRLHRIYWVAGILLLYYAALFLIPVPGYGSGNLSLEGNLIGWIDRNFLPGKLIQKIYDENGLITQLPALCLTIVGSLAGDVLRSERKEAKKLQILLLAGVAGVGIGLFWGLHFPINKHLWSSSFIMLTSGMALLILSLFYYIIDVLKYQNWAFFFQVIGMNSLTIYLAYHFIDFQHTSHALFAGLYAPLPEQFHDALEALGALVLVWSMMYFLFRKKIFIKI